MDEERNIESWVCTIGVSEGFVCFKIIEIQFFLFTVWAMEAMMTVDLQWEVASGHVGLYINYEIWTLVIK